MVLGAAVAAVLILGSGCHSPEPPARQAIMILLDAARADRFSSYGYHKPTTPAMDALASRGGLFLAHYTPAPGTRDAVPALFFSRYYAKPLLTLSRGATLSQPRDLFQGEDPEAVAFTEVLAQSGIETAAISAHPWLQPEAPFARHFGDLRFLPPEKHPSRHEPRARADAVIEQAISWLDEHKDDSFFLYLHLMDTHFPHFFDEDAREFFADEGLATTDFDAARFDPMGRPRDRKSALSPLDRRYLDALYDGDLRFTDRALGTLVEFLESAGRLDETLIVITADHGEKLLEQPGEFEHGGTLTEPNARIPLIIHYPPRVAPERFTFFSELTDVAPTILSLMDVAVPDGKTLDGSDLLAIARGKLPQKEAIFGPRYMRTERYKLQLRNRDSEVLQATAPAPRTLRGLLFDLEADPNETKNEFSERPEVVAELVTLYRRRMTARYRRFIAATSSEQPKASFAIGANHMETEREITAVSRSLRQEELQQLPGPTDWLKSRGTDPSPTHFLYAHPGAQPLEVSLRLPNGLYEVSVGMAGQGVVELGGRDADETFAVGDPAKGGFGGKGGWQESLGPVEIADERFSARLVPAQNGDWLIKNFGFRPIVGDSDAPGASEDEEMLSRLRALGYVE